MANTRDLVGVGEIKEYGSTQQEEELRVVPLAMHTRHPASWKTKTVVRTLLLVGTAVGALLLLAGPSKMMTTRNTSRNVVVDGMVVSSTATQADTIHFKRCRVPPVDETFNGYSCRDSTGYCAGPGGPFAETHESLIFFETCYKTDVPNLPFVAPNGRCWTASHRVKTWSWDDKQFSLSAYTCDPDFDGSTDIYKKKGIWHISAPLSDGSCGYPCPEAYSLWLWPPPTE